MLVLLMMMRKVAVFTVSKFGEVANGI